MNQAANTDPTKNKVFDITLLLEKVTEQFDAFKAAVKTIIYDHLNFTINIGTFSYTECKIAKWVWRIVDNWGFGAVDRIIDFFKSSDMQNRLANVLLGNTELQQQLNYNGASGSLNYFAVAHVGILVFADWIFNTYIKSVPALYKTWQWIMGIVPGFSSSDTLVDVVNKIWNAGSAAITAIKNAANNFVQGIKDGVNFIQTAVQNAIIDLTVFVIRTILKVINILYNATNSNLLTIRTSSEGVMLNGIEFQIYRQNSDLIIQLGQIKINFGGFVFNTKFQFETLGLFDLNDLILSTADTIAFFGTLLLMNVMPQYKRQLTVAGIAIQTAIFGTGLTEFFESSATKVEKEKFAARMSLFYFIQAIEFGFLANEDFKLNEQSYLAKLVNWFDSYIQVLMYAYGFTGFPDVIAKALLGIGSYFLVAKVTKGAKAISKLLKSEREFVNYVVGFSLLFSIVWGLIVLINR